jgi:hypothetical protein
LIPPSDPAGTVRILIHIEPNIQISLIYRGTGGLTGYAKARIDSRFAAIGVSVKPVSGAAVANAVKAFEQRYRDARRYA